MTNHVKVYEKNSQGRTFFMTDCHGNFDLLHEQMKLHAFDTSVDRLFVGGDNCDRGPTSHWVMDYINEPWYISIQANHESMLINAYENPDLRHAYEMLYFNGGAWYYDLTPQKQKEIYEAFKALPLAIEVETSLGKVGIIHAEVPRGDWCKFKDMTNAEIEWEGEAIAQWARTRYDRQDTTPIKNIDLVLVGHTPTKSGEIEKLGNTWYCDLGSFFRNKLCFLEIT